MCKELQLIVDAIVEEQTKQAEEDRINDMRHVREAAGWTVQQILDAFQIPMEKQERYASLLS